MSAGTLAAAALLGLASIPHCMGMCGPLAAACGQTRPSTLSYHLARLTTYGSLGAIASLAASPLRDFLPSGAPLWVLGVITAAALLVSARRVLRTRTTPRDSFVPVASLTRKDGSIPSLAPVGLGMLTGLLPCGSLYGALAVAATSTRTHEAVFAMLVFGVVSGVGLALSSVATRLLVADASGVGRRVVASVLVVGAVLALTRPLVDAGGTPTCHSEGATP